jgi:hypothetical protein
MKYICGFRAPVDAHGGALRWSSMRECWTCRRHSDDRLLERPRKNFAKTLSVLPKHAEHRLLGGKRVPLRGPRVGLNIQGSDIQCLAANFVLESLRVDLRHMGRMPSLAQSLFTFDAIMSCMHKEKALAELNPTSQTVIHGLVCIIDAFLPVSDSRNVCKVAPHVFIAALTVRRIGGNAFAKRYLALLAQAGQKWRRKHGHGFPPLVLQEKHQTSSRKKQV